MKRQRSEQIDTSSGGFDIKKFFKAPDSMTDEDYVSTFSINIRFSWAP